MARLMSEAEQRRRQKLQSKIGRTTSTMGLTALGVTGAAAVAAKKPGVLKAIQKAPGLKNATPKGMESAALKSGIVSGGIGGVGGFNQASIYSAESRRRKQAVPVKKELGMEMGYYGEEGRPLTHEQIETEIEKAWTPTASNFDAEKSRKKRAGAYQGAALVGSGAGGAYAAHHGMHAVHEGKKIRTIDAAPRIPAEETVKSKGGKEFTRNVIRHGKAFRALDVDVAGKALKHAGKAGIGLAAVGGAAATHSAIKRKKQGGWQSYAKRDTTSAFGVDHSDNPNGQHRETEN
jgi:hypothetical protein